RVVLRVLRRVEDERERTEIVKRVLPRIRQLSGREELLDLVGHREDPADLLIPEAEADALYREQDRQVLAAQPSALAEERQLTSLFHRAVENGGKEPRARLKKLLDDDGGVLRLLRSAYSEHQ